MNDAAASEAAGATSTERSAAADSVDVGVIVVTYNSADVIGSLLPTLEDGLKGLDWRAVFVDNNSSDDTADIIEAAGFKVVRRTVNTGYSAAINHGATFVSGARSVLVLNPDVELMPGSVGVMVEALANDRVGIVAPKMLRSDEQSSLEPSQRHDPSLLRTWGTALLGGGLARRFDGVSEKVSDPRCYDVVRDVDWAVGAVLLTKRACLDVLGGWDESYFLYSEETDYCQRARDAGFAVRYTPHAVVRHKGGDGLVDPRLRAMMIVNKVREFRRRRGPIASWCFFAGTLFHEATRGLAGRRASRTAALALISPRRRPPEISASGSLMPR